MKPPRSNGTPPADSFKGGVAAAGEAPKRLPGGGKDRADSGASDVVVVEGPTSLTPYGLSAKAPGSVGVQKHKRDLRPEAVTDELATPLTAAGAGDVGAECDVTPLQSRPPRDTSGSRARGDSPSLAALLGGGGIGGAETASEGAGSTSASGPEEGGAEGRAPLKRKDTITWESFLANMSVTDGAKEGSGGAKGAPASDSSSPADGRLPREAPTEHPQAEVSEMKASTSTPVCLVTQQEVFFSFNPDRLP